MDFKLTELQELVRKTAREFAENEVMPIATKIDDEDRIPVELREKMAKMGWYSIIVPPEYGGAGADYTSYETVLMELARASPGLAFHLGTHMMGVYTILNFGNEDQKRKYLSQFAEGKISVFMFTEPTTGSDRRMITTKAQLDGNEYVINGTKRYITNAPLGHIGVVWAKDESGDLSTFIVEMDRKGVSIGRIEKKMGLKGFPMSDVIFDNVRIPKENLLGERGKGFRMLVNSIAAAKLGLSAQCVGIMQAALDETINYTKNKVTQGKTLTEFHSTQQMIGEMATKLEAAKWMVFRTAWLKEQGADIVKDCAMTKLFASTAVVDVVRTAIQIFGDDGYFKPYKVEQLWRDAKPFELMEGTSEIQRAIITRGLLSE